MTAPGNDYPNKPSLRFALGFGVASIVTFLGLVLFGSESAKNAGVVSLLIGIAAGTVAAWSKRWLAFLVDIFTSI